MVLPLQKLYQLAVCAGIADESDDHAVAADKFISAIKDMKEYFQIGDTFSEIQKKIFRNFPDMPIKKRTRFIRFQF